MGRYSDLPTGSGQRVVVRVSPPVVEQIRASLAPGANIAKPRLASSVMLVRGGEGERPGREVFMIRRASSMTFVPEAAVFPGGGVRDEDADEDIAWLGPDDAEWARRLGLDDRRKARLLIVAAIRELFEEGSVLLAGDERSVVSLDFGNGEWREERSRLEAHEISFAELLSKHGLALRTDLLAPRSRWVTPKHSPKRFDTFFFAALLPAGQEAQALTREASVSGWVDPADIVARADAGKVRLMPPTAYNLNTLIRAEGIDSFVGESPCMDALLLEPADDGAGGFRLECPLP